MKNFETKSGLTLPVIDLKGKDYILVAHRVLWWRTENPLGRIDTECVEKTEKFVVYKATISVPVDKEYVKLADAYKREDFAHFGDAHEKASTGAIGRALALSGYGTQFAPDLDEEDRIVDAPIQPAVIPARPGNKERTELLRLSKERGWSVPDVLQSMMGQFKKDKVDQLTMEEYRAVLKIVGGMTHEAYQKSRPSN